MMRVKWLMLRPEVANWNCPNILLYNRLRLLRNHLRFHPRLDPRRRNRRAVGMVVSVYTKSPTKNISNVTKNYMHALNIKVRLW